MLYPLLALAMLASVTRQGRDADSVRHVRYTAAMHALDDSLGTVRAATARFQADLPNASPDLILARSSRLQARCVGAARAAAALDSVLPPTAPHRALAELRVTLSHCTEDFAPGRGYERVDSLRAWAPHRMAQIEEAAQRYHLAVAPLEKKPPPKN